VAALASLGTHLPVWGTVAERVAGPDEDAVTLAVAAARACLIAAAPGAESVDRVVFVSRDLPLLDGGNGAALLAGIGLAADVPVVEQLGGAPEVLQAVGTATPGTLVVAADLAPAGAGAVLIGATGADVVPAGQVTRSLPIRSRARDGVERNYDDPRLQRERGHGAAIEALALPSKPAVVAGLSAKLAAAVTAGRPPSLPTLGASSAVFALAAAVESASTPVLVLGVEQASAAALTLMGPAPVRRDEPAPQPMPRLTDHPGPDIAISLAAYERAFEPKLRWEAGRCDACGTLALPPRRRCLGCGSESGWTLAPLPRTGSVYTVVTIHVPVPGLRTPYSLAIVELDGTDVRALVKVTGVPAGSVAIDDRGTLVLRRVAVRNGIPDYGYALLPDTLSPDTLLPDIPADDGTSREAATA
jgi:uncharacterized protein